MTFLTRRSSRSSQNGAPTENPLPRGESLRNAVVGVAGPAARLARSRLARWGFVAVAVGLADWAVVSHRTEVLSALRRLDAATLAAAALATAGNVLLAGMVWWTAMSDLGSRLPLRVAARIFYIGQLGKYVPGSVWPLIAQAELGRDYQVPRRRTATATVVTMLLGVTSALLLALVTLPFAPGGVLPAGVGWVELLVIPLLVVLHPAVLSRGVNRALRLAGREPLEQPTSLGGTARATAWAVGSWAFAGLQVFVLAVGLGAPADAGTLALAIGGYALAWAVGFVVVVAPAGAGARELVLAAFLSRVLDSGSIVVAVLLSRVLFTCLDLGLAGLAVIAVRRHLPAAGARGGPGENRANNGRGGGS